MKAGVRIPPKLRRIAAGTDPKDFLRDVLVSARTLEDAATELGVTTVTLWRWRRIFGLDDGDNR